MIAAALTTAMSLNVAAQTPSGERAVIEIVRLQHRDPAPIRQAIEPLLDERGAISQIDNNLVISTTRSNLTELQELISELDVPRRQLRVSVDFRYGRPAAAMSSPGADGSSVTTVATQDPSDYSVQSIVLSEGEFAYFSLASSTPRTGLRFTELGAVLSQDSGQQSNQTASSLAIGAELRGSRAVLTIAATQRQPALGGVESSGVKSSVVNSTLEVDFNTWQIVSSVADNPSALSTVSAQTQILATTNSPESVAVRVELLP
ncbi:MAG: secretin N-terminal domain-containing protein [Pseudomonadota bacterium]